MVQLRSCYFCGTTGALSEYEALPPALGGDEDTVLRVILCDRCHTKLTNVLAPFVERLDRGEFSADSSVTETAEASDDAASTPADRSSVQPEVTFSSPSTPTTEGATDETSGAPEENADAVAGADERDSTRHSRESRDVVADEAVETDDTAEAGDVAETDDGVDDPTAEAGDVAETASETGADDDTAEPPTDLDRVYHKLRRFLRNREFPLPRAEAEAIAQSAYDLTASEASQVIQRTVDRDVLEERDGELHRS